LEAAPDDPDLTAALERAQSSAEAAHDLASQAADDGPDGLAQLLRELATASEDLTAATQQVQSWLAEECEAGPTTTTTTAAAPAET
jgi:hypothetical protein